MGLNWRAVKRKIIAIFDPEAEAIHRVIDSLEVGEEVIDPYSVIIYHHSLFSTILTKRFRESSHKYAMITNLAVLCKQSHLGSIHIQFIRPRDTAGWQYRSSQIWLMATHWGGCNINVYPTLKFISIFEAELRAGSGLVIDIWRDPN